MVDKTINDVSLKNLTFQTGQKSGTDGVINYCIPLRHTLLKFNIK